uniref:GP-PDE domain-containing protein n=1 Tax=Angiostrongylus cantonensis TaxID=6313 RepID=A0A0K0DQH2_ANGCA
MAFTIKNAPRIRSLIRLTLPKYFDAKTYIWNRFSSADAILIDIRQKTTYTDPWRRQVLAKVLDGVPYKPRVYLEATSRRISRKIWAEDIATCSHKGLYGFLIKVRDGNILNEVETIVRRDGKPLQQLVEGDHRILSKIVPHYQKDAALLMDFELKAIPYAVFKYHNFGSRDEGSWSRLEELVNYAQLANVKALAWRSMYSARVRDIEREMLTLKEIGFSGVLVRNSALIDMANKIFE